MPITLAGLSFDEAHTEVKEDHDEVGGRNERSVLLTGLIVGENTVTAIEAQLDTILDAASVEDFSAALSLRPGRQMMVRREEFRRQIQRDSLVGTFVLELRAMSPFEEAVSETSLPWTVAVSGATFNATSVGTVYSELQLSLIATGTLVNPAFDDGVRTLSFSGTVADGETLVLDGRTGLVTLEGVDVTPYTSGLFPQISPQGTTLRYQDDASSTHTGQVTVDFRDRWW